MDNKKIKNICNKHFEKKHIGKARGLKKGAVPTLFHFNGLKVNNRKSLLCDHSYCMNMETLKDMKSRAKKTKVKLDTVSRRKRKLESEKKSLTEVVEDATKKFGLSLSESLKKCASSVPASLFENMAKKQKLDDPTRFTYDNTVRQFALTLHLYSAKAYR